MLSKKILGSGKAEKKNSYDWARVPQSPRGAGGPVFGVLCVLCPPPLLSVLL